jgi:putative Mg2+ transporter-C (MgtC) family protein
LVYYTFSLNDWLHVSLRLSLALLIGAIVGWNREVTGKPAGLRTHMLVSFGSALFVMVPIQLAGNQPSHDAISRIIQGVATGIGFLGAGEILRQSDTQAGRIRIRGLTSAAAIWVSAALGVAIGAGLWQIGLIGSLLALITLSSVKKLERFLTPANRTDDKD